MKLSLIGHNYKYELEKLIRIFLPFEKIEFCDDEDFTENCAITKCHIVDNNVQLIAKLNLNGKTADFSDSILNNCDDFNKECERLLAVQLYKCFVKITGYGAPWGILTGVRPAKLYSRLALALGEENADSYFLNKLLVSKEKLEICKESVKGEEKIISLSKPDSFSLYISIPFCPTRCTYCSFVSHSVKQAKKLIPQYVNLLCEELIETAKIVKQCNLTLETVYIGGGTPTSIDAELIQKIMTTVSENFSLENVREYTVEAGRPDTITKDKLLTIKNGGATRISINPQTMNDDVLKNIGRNHDSKQTVDAFMLARSCGFDNINMDLIAGLPGDTIDSFDNTLSKVISLNPESITVHSLSVKRASTLNSTESTDILMDGITASKMVLSAKERLTQNGIFPYYMYRQSKTVGNLENVGYAKKGYEGLYNVYIMDETHSILACGASAVTKLREPNGAFIDRIFNFKYPYEYIDRFGEIIERKKNICDFYNKYFH